MKDFFKDKYEFKTIITQDTITHETVDDVTGRMIQEVINIKEKATKDALIEMGWLPPEDKEELLDHIHKVVEPFRSLDYMYRAVEVVDNLMPYCEGDNKHQWSEDFWDLAKLYTDMEGI